MIRDSALGAAASVRHGFFTRRGGVSGGLFASLNCGYGSNDDTDAVTENRARAMARLDLAGEPLVTCYQIHSATVARVEAPWAPGDAPRADAMVTRAPNIALGILTADCAPVLFAAPGVIGAAHAGWRGALAGVLEATVAAMADLGAAPDSIHACVGPAIARESYEVGPEFPAPFLDQDPDNAALFRPGARAGHALFDLAGYAARRLGRLGLAGVTVLDHDTYRDSERFFSYRRGVHRDEPAYGRGLSAIALAP